MTVPNQTEQPKHPSYVNSITEKALQFSLAFVIQSYFGAGLAI
jgi:hypothetical protein